MKVSYLMKLNEVHNKIATLQQKCHVPLESIIAIQTIFTLPILSLYFAYICIYLLDVLTLFIRLFIQGMYKLNQRNQISSFQATWTCAWKNYPLCARFDVHTVVLLRGFKFSGMCCCLSRCFTGWWMNMRAT